eukprot:2638494-Rhodomonas_salina.1
MSISIPINSTPTSVRQPVIGENPRSIASRAARRPLGLLENRLTLSDLSREYYCCPRDSRN